MRSKEEIDEWFQKFEALIRRAKERTEAPDYVPPERPPRDPVDEALEKFLVTPMDDADDMLILDEDGDIKFVHGLALFGPFAVRFTLPELAGLVTAMGVRVVARAKVGLRDFEHIYEGPAYCWPELEEYLAPDRFVEDGEIFADLDSVDEGALLKLVDMWDSCEAHRHHPEDLSTLLVYIHARLGTKALARPGEA